MNTSWKVDKERWVYYEIVTSWSMWLKIECVNWFCLKPKNYVWLQAKYLPLVLSKFLTFIENK